MNSARINAVVDLAALIFFIPSLISGLVLLIALPVGSPLRSVYLGTARLQWIRMHDVTSILLAALIILHIALHWRFYRKIAGAWGDKNEEDNRTE